VQPIITKSKVGRILTAYPPSFLHFMGYVLDVWVFANFGGPLVFLPFVGIFSLKTKNQKFLEGWGDCRDNNSCCLCCSKGNNIINNINSVLIETPRTWVKSAPILLLSSSGFTTNCNTNLFTTIFFGTLRSFPSSSLILFRQTLSST